jgi:hypothetical protein
MHLPLKRKNYFGRYFSSHAVIPIETNPFSPGYSTIDVLKADFIFTPDLHRGQPARRRSSPLRQYCPITLLDELITPFCRMARHRQEN